MHGADGIGAQRWNWSTLAGRGVCQLHQHYQVIWMHLDLLVDNDLQNHRWKIISRWRCKDPKHLIQKKGDPESRSETIESECLWTRSYTVSPSDLECIISFCVDAPVIPDSASMEELTDIKTRVNTSKLYQCQVSFGLTLFSRERWSQYVTQSKFEGIFNSHRNSDQSNQGVKGDGNHTRYWESDRSRSTFSIPCLPDGTFDFVNSTESWPVPGSLFYSYHCTLRYLKKKMWNHHHLHPVSIYVSLRCVLKT